MNGTQLGFNKYLSKCLEGYSLFLFLNLTENMLDRRKERGKEGEKEKTRAPTGD